MRNPMEMLADKVEKTSQEVRQKGKEIDNLRGPTPNSRHSLKRTQMGRNHQENVSALKDLHFQIEWLTEYSAQEIKIEPHQDPSL